jgi:hypothetical protein
VKIRADSWLKTIWALGSASAIPPSIPLNFGVIENDASVNRLIMSAGQWKALL